MMTKGGGTKSAKPAPEGSTRTEPVASSGKSGSLVPGHSAGIASAAPSFIGNVRIKKAGGSLTTTIPAAVRNMLHLVEGQEMAVHVDGEKVIFQSAEAGPKIRKPRYTLEELVGQCDPDAPMTDEEKAWHDAAPVGREIW